MKVLIAPGMKLFLKTKYLKISFIFLFLCQYFCFPGISSAWFTTPDSVEQPSWHKQNNGAKNRSGTKTLFVYDNLINHHGQTPKPYLMPSNQFFVPADRINIDMPLIMLSQRSGSSLESIDALLYANLELELLFDDYRTLRKRTDKLLKSLNVPYLEQLRIKTIKNMNIIFYDSDITNKHFIGIQGYSKDSIHQGNVDSASGKHPVSIGQQRNMLAYKMTEVARNSITGTFHLSEKDIPSFTGLNRKSADLTPGGKKIFTVTNTSDRTDITITGSGLSYNGGNPGGGLYPPAPPDAPEPDGKYDSEKKVVSFNNTHQEELPWIFRMILHIIKFVLSNKIESVFYGTVSLLIIFFISLKARE